MTGSRGASNGAPVVPPADTTPPTALRGATLYAEYCARCHGDSAQGTKIWPANIQGRVGIHDQVRNGVRGMPSFPQISDSGIRSIELFLASFQVDFGARSGEELYNTFCGSCHGGNALGAPTHPASIQGYAPIRDIVRNGRGTMAAIPIVDSLIARIQTYISSLRVDLGSQNGEELYNLYCRSCHGDKGLGTLIHTGSIQGYDPIHDIVKNGRGQMVPVLIPDSLVARIQQYLNSFQIDRGARSGEELYVTYCRSCHGDKGLGTLVHPGSIQGYEPIHDIVRSGRGTMVPIPIADTTIAKIQDYLKSFRVDLGAKSGKDLYAMYCLSCHGDEALGTLVHPASIQGYEPIRDIVRNGRGQMVPIPVADSLIARIQDYLRSLGPNPGALPGDELYALYCQTCHGTRGLGTLVHSGSIQGYEPIRDIVRYGRGQMVAMPIADSLIRKIQEYLKSFGTDLSTRSGSELYSMYCMSCHGDKGLGSIVHPNSIQGYEPIHDIVRYGRGSMVPLPLSDVLIAKIQDYLKSFGVNLGAKSGEELYTLYCLSCHGDRGGGTLVHPGSIQGYEPILDIVRRGRGQMVPIAIPDSLISRIQTYLKGLGPNLGSKTGEELYTMYCLSCHGDKGLGTIVHAGSIQGYEPIRDVVRNGRGTMVALPLADSLITRIQTYLKSFGPNPGAMSGAELYTMYCASCHGDKGLGTIVHPGSIQGYDPIRDVVRYGRGTMVAMPIADSLIARIQTYLKGLVPDLTTKTGEELYTMYCYSCHGDRGLGTLVHQGSIQGYDPIRDIVRSGRGSMLPMTISDTLISKIQIYLKGLQPNLSSKSGEELYALYCKTCHGDQGRGTILHPGSIQGYDPIHDIVRYGRGTMVPMSIADTLISKIQTYLKSFNTGTQTGQQLYATYCASCHGSDANGTTTYPGSLQAYQPAIHDIVRYGRGQMPSVSIPDSSIAKIQEYLRSFQVDLSRLSGVEYYARVCASCHASDGAGTARGPEVRNPVAGYATWVIQNGRAGHPWFTDSMPRYSSTMLTSSQLNGILSWLQSSQHPTTGQGLYIRFCGTCHGADGRGGTTGKRITGNAGDIPEIVRRGHGGTNYSSRGNYMPSWSTSEITNTELTAIRTYVQSLR